VHEGVSNRLGVDFKKDLLDALDGRITTATWVERPARVNSQCQLAAVRLKDAAAFQPTFEKMLKQAAGSMKKDAFAGVTIHRFVTGPFNDGPNPEDLSAEEPPFRVPEACLAILGDYLIFTDSQKLMEQAIAANSDSSLSLANDLEFKVVASKIRRQAGTDTPFLIRFSRPEETMRQFYDLAANEQTKKSLAAQAGRSRIAGAFSNALRDNPLPPFEVIADYLAPSGGFMTNDSSGLHYLGFVLKREAGE
jgi:hypothetical protein